MILNMGGSGVVPKVNLDETTITPGTTNRVIDEGTYLKGALTILGDADLVPANIKKGINIFGVQGTCKPNYGTCVWKKLEEEIQSVSGTLSVQFVMQITGEPYDDNSFIITLPNNIPNFVLKESDFYNWMMWSEPVETVKCRLYFYSNNELDFAIYDTSTQTLTTKGKGSWHVTNGKLKITGSGNSLEGYYNFNVSKLVSRDISSLTTIGYVVSDDSSEYPSNGKHTDGYYYQRINV